MRLLDLMMMVVIVNYFNAKKSTILPKMSAAERLKVNNSKVVGIGASSSKPSHC